MPYQIWEGALRGWLIDLCTNTPARGIVSEPTPQVIGADKEPGQGRYCLLWSQSCVKVLPIPVLGQRVTISDKKFRVSYSKPTHLTDPKVSSGMNQYQFRLYLNILFKYSLSLLMLGWEVQSFKYTLSYTEIFFYLGTTRKHMNAELSAQIP